MALPLFALVLLGGATSPARAEPVFLSPIPVVFTRSDCPGRLVWPRQGRFRAVAPAEAPPFEAILDDDDSDDVPTSLRLVAPTVPVVRALLQPVRLHVWTGERTVSSARPRIYTLCTLLC